jgi:hypothetical protein
VGEAEENELMGEEAEATAVLLCCMQGASIMVSSCLHQSGDIAVCSFCDWLVLVKICAAVARTGFFIWCPCFFVLLLMRAFCVSLRLRCVLCRHCWCYCCCCCCRSCIWCPLLWWRLWPHVL